MGDITDDQTRAQPADGTLADVVESLGNRTLSVLAAPTGLDLPITGTVLYDRFEALPQGHGALLFASGLRESDPGWATLITQAASSGYSGIVLKRWAGDTQLLVTAATVGNMALLTTPVETHWRDLDALVNGLISARLTGLDSVAGEDWELLDLVNVIAVAAGGSVVIEDLNRRILEYSSVQGQRIDEVRRTGILAHQVPDVPSNADQYRRVLAAEGIVHFDKVGEEMARSAVTIRTGTRPLGTIWVIEGPDGLSVDARATLLSGAPLAALQLLLARHAREQDVNARSAALLAALGGSWTAKDTPHPSFPPAGTDFVLIGFASCAASMPGGVATDEAIEQTGAMLTRYFAAFCPDAWVAATEQTVFALVPQGADSADRLAGAAIVAPGRSTENQLKAAIAHGSAPSELPSIRREVEDVLAVTTSEPDLPTVARLADVFAGVVLKHIGEVLGDHPRLRHAGIDAMTAHDRTRDTDYASSVLAWLDAVGDIGEASRRIGVHPNTLRYRLRRAGELFAFDLDRPDDRLSLWLHLRLLT